MEACWCVSASWVCSVGNLCQQRVNLLKMYCTHLLCWFFFYFLSSLLFSSSSSHLFILNPASSGCTKWYESAEPLPWFDLNLVQFKKKLPRMDLMTVIAWPKYCSMYDRVHKRMIFSFTVKLWVLIRQILVYSLDAVCVLLFAVDFY